MIVSAYAVLSLGAFLVPVLGKLTEPLKSQLCKHNRGSSGNHQRPNLYRFTACQLTQSPGSVVGYS